MKSSVEQTECHDISFAATLVAWQKQCGRHSLPWQNTRDAYKVWLSEIMLQQTQVATVIPYYQRFLVSFPDVFSLASAQLEDVMKLWSGLGYYSRARNLHKCAQIVVHEYGGIFPSDPAVLEQLPGIGKSTAAAIAVFSSGVRAAIMDGNVVRIFSRIFGIADLPTEKTGKDKFWELAYTLLPDKNLEAYTQGLMDLGATVCVRSRPDCKQCPFSDRCVALDEGKIENLPARKPKKSSPVKQVIMLVLHTNGQVLFEKRPESGIWGGLYSLPEKEWRTGEKSLIEAGMVDELVFFASSFGTVASMVFIEPFVHMFSHFRLEITPCIIELSGRSMHMADDAWFWYDMARLDEAPIPAPVRKLLENALRQKSVSQ